MSSTLTRTTATTDAAPARLDMKLEIVVIPVSDVERAKAFYVGLGWRLDADFAAGPDWRGVPGTPPGSGRSGFFRTHLTPAAPRSAQRPYFIVSDLQGALPALRRRGLAVRV